MSKRSIPLGIPEHIIILDTPGSQNTKKKKKQQKKQECFRITNDQIESCVEGAVDPNIRFQFLSLILSRSMDLSSHSNSLVQSASSVK